MYNHSRSPLWKFPSYFSTYNNRLVFQIESKIESFHTLKIPFSNPVTRRPKSIASSGGIHNPKIVTFNTLGAEIKFVP